MRLVALVLLVTTVVACGSDGAERRGSSGDQAAETILPADGCEELAEELGHGTAPAMQIGNGCTLEVRSHGALRRVDLRSVCPEQASILLPFDEVDAGWVLDRRELAQIDNGDCLNGG